MKEGRTIGGIKCRACRAERYLLNERLRRSCRCPLQRILLQLADLRYLLGAPPCSQAGPRTERLVSPNLDVPSQFISTKLLTLKEAANRLAISLPTIRSWVWQRRIEIVKIGRCVRIRDEGHH